MPRRLRYQVAVSLDGFIAGPSGEADWIVSDRSIDFDALLAEFDTLVMGRKTHEAMVRHSGHSEMPGVEVFVFSRTLPASSRHGVHIVNEDPRKFVAALKAKPGRDIWLFGGGDLFRSLLDAGLVDTVEVAVMPVLLGSGVPLVLPGGGTTNLVLADHRILPASGIVALSYAVQGAAGPPARIAYVKTRKAKRGKKRSTSRRSARSARRKSPATKRRG
jgi:dihydrofolate reductase